MDRSPRRPRDRRTPSVPNRPKTVIESRLDRSNMNRREFLSSAGAAAFGLGLERDGCAQPPEPPLEHRLPATDQDYQRSKSYIEEVPTPEYHWASERAIEA